MASTLFNALQHTSTFPFAPAKSPGNITAKLPEKGRERVTHLKTQQLTLTSKPQLFNVKL